MDASTKALVGAGNHDESPFVVTLEWLGLGLLEDGIGGLTVLS